MNRKVTYLITIFCLLYMLPQAHGNTVSNEWHSSTQFPSQTGNKLLFTYFSPDYSWTAEESNILSSAVADFYPIIASIYGDPAFTITVNIRKDPTITFAGEYSPKTKEIVLRDATQLDVLCHEMIHAFRDENMILINTYEEGMTRAVEVEVFNRLADYTFWNENHSYMYDVYYDGLNRQVIGSQFGNFDYASPFLLLRYDLAGYAWAKVFYENQNFFADFNRMLYREILQSPSILSNASALRDLASSLQPVVEGKPFLAWYEQQGIFDPTPQEGYFLYQNISNFNVYYCFRDISGAETMIADTTIQWEIYDYEDNLISSGYGVTSSLGWIWMNPVFPTWYKGRVKIVTSAFTPDGFIRNTAVTAVGNNGGIFGILEDNDTGRVVIKALDSDIPSVSADVVHGTFSAPSLGMEKGKFIAVYDDGNGQTFSKQFNKDASNYFLPMVKSSAVSDLSIFLTVTPGEGSVESNLTYTLTIANNGPDTATEVFLSDLFSPGVTIVSAEPARGSCSLSASTATCALDTLSNGAATTVVITTIPTQTGAIVNNAYVTANVSDPDIINNRVVLTSTIGDIDPAIKIIKGLISRIGLLVAQEMLNHGQGESLTALLETAKRHIDQDRPIPALSQVDAFINHVNAFVRVGILPQAEGEELKSMAQDVIAQLTRQHQVPEP